MRFSSRLRNWKRAAPTVRRHTQTCARQPASFQPWLEALEDRTLPSVFNLTVDPILNPSGAVNELIGDINAANQAGGTNQLNLYAGGVYDLTAANNATNGANGLPVISAKHGDNLTINGNGGTIQRDPAAPHFRLFDVAGGNSLTLQNLTLTGGLAYGSGAATDGGAIYNQGTLTVSGVTVQGNTAQGSNGAGGSTVTTKKKTQPHAAQPGANSEGGGVWSSGTVTLKNGATIQGNKAIGGQGGKGASHASDSGPGGNGLGGGLYVAGGSVNATSTGNESAVIFSGNQALGGVGGGITPYDKPGRGGNGSGGGLYVAGGTVSAIGTGSASAVIFTGNEALGGAGGIGYIYGTSFSFQFPYGGSGSGGGLYVAGGTLHMSHDTVRSNKAVGGTGGGEHSYRGAGGTGGYGFGGGLFVTGSSVVVTLADVNLSSNLAQGGQGGTSQGPGGQGGNAYGGGLYVGGGTVALTGDMVTGNQAIGGLRGNGNTPVLGYEGEGTGAGGGIYNNGGTLTISNSDFSSNSPDNIHGPYGDEGGNTFS